jgi:dihydroorotate dehydrogenase
MRVYRRAVLPLLGRLDAERAHELTLGALGRGHRLLGALPGLRVEDPRLRQRLLGLDFPNPLGVAAGVDKRAVAVPAWAALGFGFAEVGTVTPDAQPGNPRPRVFRLPRDAALVNRLGFPNDGAAATAARLEGSRRRGLAGAIPIGVNLGKGRATPAAEAAGDYAAALRRLAPHVDFAVVNVSSPNTPRLRDLQEEDALRRILAALRATAALPILVKLAPDLADGAFDALVDLAGELRADGLVITNTTTERRGLRSPRRLTREAGGLSGRPLRARSTELVRRAAARAGDDLVIVGVGGVADGDDAWDKLAAGARLVQVYTGLVLGGPHTAARILAGLLERMDREGVPSIDALAGRAVGAHR